MPLDVDIVRGVEARLDIEPECGVSRIVSGFRSVFYYKCSGLFASEAFLPELVFFSVADAVGADLAP